MTERAEGREDRLGFLDALGRVFRRRAEAPAAAQPAAEPTLGAVEADFQAALRTLNETIEAQRRTNRPRAAGAAAAAPAADREADQRRRTETAHREIREDIVAKHAELGTGIGAGDLDALAAFLGELEGVAAAGRGSHEMMARMRYAIAERLWREAGPLAVARLVALLQGRQMAWPDPIRPGPTETAEQIERARSRRLADVREVFLAQDFARTAERMLGVVRGWQGDYPDRGSALWQESVLEAVACGLRARLVSQAVEILRRDREALFAQVEGAIGAEIGALQRTVAGGVRSIEQASQAVAGAMRVLDDVVPGIAWERVRAELPEARATSAA